MRQIERVGIMINLQFGQPLRITLCVEFFENGQWYEKHIDAPAGRSHAERVALEYSLGSNLVYRVVEYGPDGTPDDLDTIYFNDARYKKMDSTP